MSREEQLVSRGVIAEWEEYKEAKASMSPPREYWRAREEEDKIISDNTTSIKRTRFGIWKNIRKSGMTIVKGIPKMRKSQGSCYVTI